ncbi:hypothetical protein HFN71_28890 [Rhizobium laguerreae]|uniref:hypothetical protein n=1 Tax=Rhizobium laguerreae TaxID=1076926 RepID=UPI001C91A278|nr:hypothetical protein [Rhizobium laguerreae]MBY3543702.1 hypothetical protein [Rhizobium laguerreae]
MPAITFSQKQYSDIGKRHRQDPADLSGNALDAKQNDASADRQIMVEGLGVLPVVPPKYTPANDNVPQDSGTWRLMCDGQGRVGVGWSAVPANSIPKSNPFVGGQYIGLQRSTADRGPFIQIYPARKFFPFDPLPSEVFIESIAHGLANICRYSGAGDRHFSVAEHSTLIARYLAARHAPEVALAGLLHDAPESLSGFGDVSVIVKSRAPIISETEDGIYRKAIAPRFGLPLDIPAEVHEADRRIIADEIAANLAPMEWQSRHRDPLGVNIRCWSPEKAEIEFLATFDALTGRAMRMES